MTISECMDAVLGIFSELYPDCTVAISYPGMSERPPLPYILLDFGKVTTRQVDGSFSKKDGILYQSWYLGIPLTVDMVIPAKTTHFSGEMVTRRPYAFQDLSQASVYLNSPMGRDKLYDLNLSITEDSGAQPIYGSAPSVDRAQCSFTVDFTMTSKEYAALRPVGDEYIAERRSSASKVLADKEAGWFNEVDCEIKVR